MNGNNEIMPLRQAALIDGLLGVIGKLDEKGGQYIADKQQHNRPEGLH